MKRLRSTLLYSTNYVLNYNQAKLQMELAPQYEQKPENPFSFQDLL